MSGALRLLCCGGALLCALVETKKRTRPDFMEPLPARKRRCTAEPSAAATKTDVRFCDTALCWCCLKERTVYDVVRTYHDDHFPVVKGVFCSYCLAAQRAVVVEPPLHCCDRCLCLSFDPYYKFEDMDGLVLCANCVRAVKLSSLC